MRNNNIYFTLIFGFIVLIVNPLFSQDYIEIEKSYITKAYFRGGEGALSNYLTHNIRYPKEALRKGIEGVVTVNFVVDTLGNISYPNIIWGVSSELDKEALRLVMSMPKWAPGKVNGQKVKMNYTLPIEFKVGGGKLKEYTREYPVFNEGKDNLSAYLRDNMIYPQEAIQHKAQGIVFVEFTIDKNGKVKHPNLLTTTNNKSLDDEAIRLIKNMPLWRPAKIDGKKTFVRYVMPIEFKLP